MEVEARDRRIPISTLQSQFGPDAVGLQYRNPTTNRWRAMTVEGDTLRPPSGGWTEEQVYVLKRLIATNKGDGEFYRYTSHLVS